MTGTPVPKGMAPLDLSSGRFLNETAIRDHALRCSARFKCNRFTRVGQDFLDEVQADVEAMVRELRNKFPRGSSSPSNPQKKRVALRVRYLIE